MKLLRFIILISLLSGSSVLAYRAFWETPCDRTIEYSIGSFDDRFGISKDAFLAMVERAEAPWETESGKNIFQYKENSPFKVNLVFSDEQERIQKGDTLLVDLDGVQGDLDKNERAYNSKLTQYKKKESDYKNNLRRYEKEVSSWNAKGGAPKEIYDNLQKKKKDLDYAYVQLKKLQKEVNALVEANNKNIKKYNTGVKEYNNLFEKGREFDAGNTDGTEINIYSYKNEAELYSVLVHEFGHVLGIDHVTQEDSVMYYLLNKKNVSGELSSEDKSVFRNLCRLK